MPAASLDTEGARTDGAEPEGGDCGAALAASYSAREENPCETAGLSMGSQSPQTEGGFDDGVRGRDGNRGTGGRARGPARGATCGAGCGLGEDAEDELGGASFCELGAGGRRTGETGTPDAVLGGTSVELCEDDLAAGTREPTLGIECDVDAG